MSAPGKAIGCSENLWRTAGNRVTDCLRQRRARENKDYVNEQDQHRGAVR